MDARTQNLIDEIECLIESCEVEIRDANNNRGLIDYETGRLHAYQYCLEALRSPAFGATAT